MHLDESFEYIKKSRKPLLFIGAGFSLDALNIKGEHTPTSKILSKDILSKFNIFETAPLSYAIDRLRNEKTPDEAYDLISDALTLTSLTKNQSNVLALPWHRIYTTNIDNVGQLAFDASNIHDAIDEFRQPVKGDIVHLHGCLANASPNNFYQRVKMGEQLYVAGSHSKSRYHDQFRTDLFESDCVFVIGYGMGDPDLAELFFRTPDMINKCFVFSGDTSELESYRISLIGNDTKKSMEEFLTLVSARPKSIASNFPINVLKENNLFDLKEITQASRQNLLIFGRYDRNVARSAWASPDSPTYVVSKDIASEIAELKGPQVVIVHSHLACGKTLLREEIAFLATNSGRSTFTIDPTSTSERLLEALSSLPFGSLALFEGNIFDLKTVESIVRENSILLVSFSRTTTYRSAISKIHEVFTDIVSSYDINILTTKETQAFYEQIKEMGFWPAELKRHDEAKEISLLYKHFGPSINSIVIKIFENAEIKRWLRHLFYVIRIC